MFPRVLDAPLVERSVRRETERSTEVAQLGEVARRLRERFRPGGGDDPAPRLHEQRVARDRPQPVQPVAHRRLRDSQPVGRGGDAARFQHGQQELQQAFEDYRRTQFGGWPWGDAGPVHGEGQGRFARLGAARVEHEARIGMLAGGDEDLGLVLGGLAPRRADVESKSATLSLRSIPIKTDNERTGAIVLCRDVSELRRQERELITKDATIREIHHRVKNNLQTVASLLRIQARRANSSETKESLEQAMRRVSAIALVHDTLSEGVNQDLNFDEVFDRVLLLTSEVAASHNTSVKTLIDGKFGQLRSEIATPLAVALTEIVHNAVEHGLANRSGVVDVNAERKPKKLDITVSDNGIGMKDGKVGNGLGTQIIRTLIEGELRGTISWQNISEGGTRVVISLPL